jgi:uncharacterized membrane protein YfcA
MDSALLLFLLFLFLAEILGTLGGFGSSLFMIPLAGLFYPFHQVLLITALLHVVSNLSKIALFRHGLSRFLLLFMGLPSIIGVVIGAVLSELVNDRLASLLLGLFLSIFSIIMMLVPKWKIKASKNSAVVTGGAAGFTAGLLGTGGAIRGLGLTAFGLEKASFVATSAAIDLGVDSSRLVVYWLESDLPVGFWAQMPWMMLTSFGGTLAGRALLKKVSQEQFRNLILALVMAAGLWSLFSFFFGKH